MAQLASASRPYPALDARGVFAAVLGNGFEFFDFTVYATFLGQIGQAYVLLDECHALQAKRLRTAASAVGINTFDLDADTACTRADAGHQRNMPQA